MDTNDGFRKLVVRVVLFVLIGWAVALLRAVRRERGLGRLDGHEPRMEAGAIARGGDSDEQPATRRPFRGHKLATSMAFVVVFFAAASFTAGGGDMVAKAFDPARCAALMQVTGEDDSVCAEMMNDEAAPEAMPLPEPPPPRGSRAGAAQASEVPAELAADLAACEAGADLESASAAGASLASEPASQSAPSPRTLPQQLPPRRPGVLRARARAA